MIKKPTLKKGTTVYRWNGISRDEGVVAKKSKDQILVSFGDEHHVTYRIEEIKYQFSYENDVEVWRWNTPQLGTLAAVETLEEGDWINTYDQAGNWISTSMTDEAHKRYFWFLRDPYELLTEKGYNVTRENAEALETFTDGSWPTVCCWFTIACCTRKDLGDEFIKWIIGPLKEIIQPNECLYGLKFTASEFCGLVVAVAEKKITATMGKDVLGRMYAGEKLDAILEDDKYKISSDDDMLKFVKEVIEANPEQIEELKSGKDKILGWLVGQVMKASKGKANAGEVNKMFREELGL